MVILKDDHTEKKSTSKGRRKIEIKKIEKLSSRQVTFSKRRLGLFKKASAVCILTGAQIAIIVRSHSNRVFSFGHPTADAVIERFLKGEGAVDDCVPAEFVRDYNYLHHADVCRELEVEKKRGEEYYKGLWWCDEDVEGKTVEELEEYAGALEELRKNITTRADLLVKNNSFASAAHKLDHTEAATTFVKEAADYSYLDQQNIPPMSTVGVGCSFDDETFVIQDFNNQQY